MNILIDIQGAQNGSRHRGIGRYTRAITRKICELSLGRHRISLLANGAFDNVGELRDMFAGYIHPSDIHVWHPFGDVSFRWVGNDLRRRASEYLREAVIHEISPDALIVTSVIEGCDDTTVVTIKKHFSDTFTAAIFYDAIPAIHEKEYLSDPRSREWYFEKVEQFQRADALLAISQSSKEEAAKYFNIDKNKVINVSTASDDDLLGSGVLAKQCDLVLNRLSIDKKYLLYSGASDARKNIPRLIEAFSALPANLRTEYKLVLAGGMPEPHMVHLRAAAQAVGLHETDVIFTGWVSDEELAAIYANASLFVFPSLHEGFGLPVLEAMNFDIPVIASAVSSIPEVVALQEALFDPLSTGDITAKIEHALTDDDFRQRLLVNGRRRRKAFSWESTARRALNVVEQAPMVPRCAVAPESEARHVSHILHLLDNDSTLMDRSAIVTPIYRSLPSRNRQRRIFVDVSELHSRDSKTGIQRVVRNILTNLPRAVGDGYSVIPVAGDLGFTYRISNKVGMSHIPDYLPLTDPNPVFSEGDIFLGLDFHDVIIPRQTEVLDEMRKAGVMCYFVVYDLLPLQLRSCFPPEVGRNYNGWLNTVARYDGLIAISRAVADDLFEWMTQTRLSVDRPVRIGHFKLGSDIHVERNSRVDAELEDWLASKGRSRLFVTIGTLEPRKGHAQIISGLTELWRQGVDASLAIIGKRGWDSDELTRTLINHPEFGKRLLWLQAASDADLVATLRAADALIAASEGEGFGLPLVEAQRFGVPVIARNIPVFREVAGQEAVYFSGKSGRVMAACLKDWLKENEVACKRLEKKPGLSWPDSAAELAAIVCENRWYKTFG
jgi:glycosyltransferase involved in cell wall biosynthesis